MKILLSGDRLYRWVANFEKNHGPVSLQANGTLTGEAEDGASFIISLPFDRPYHGGAAVADFLAANEPPPSWGLLLARKSGFVVARLLGNELDGHKVARRHVQGRTKAGGQSQQRFARRRDNQAKAVHTSAAGHAHELLSDVSELVLGGDRFAVEQILSLARINPRQVSRWVEFHEARRSSLDQAINDAMSLSVQIHNQTETIR